MGRFHLGIACLVLALSVQVSTALAQEDVANLDCAAILESYAANPKAVPKSVADACQQAIIIAPGGGSLRETMVADPQAVDPCVGAGAQASVICWGPWAAPLSPAAGGTGLPVATLSATEYPTRPEALGIEPDPIEPDPAFFCTAGLPCGFATVVAGIQSIAPAEETAFARFDLAQDGSEFTVDQDGAAIESATGMSTVYSDRPDGYENMRSAGAEGDLRSRLIARVLRQGDDVQMAGDIWGHVDLASDQRNSGFFAWGVAITQADIDALTSQGAVLNFSGPMSVDNSTMADIMLAYGSDPIWSGEWNNPSYEFTAGGDLVGANFISDPSQFSSNVQEGFVQGAVVGSDGSRGITHIVEVRLDGEGLVRDVGLLREALLPSSAVPSSIVR